MNERGVYGWVTSFGDKALDWFVSSGLAVIVVLVAAYAAAAFYRVAMKRLEKVLVAQAEKKSGGGESGEMRQRIRTLSGLLTKVGVTVIWIIACMMILKEVGIDIGPLLAGAGIAGLAVGFGAQNLVRDVVSGFFILLENQIGVGDVAVINGTGGLVEEVNIRTVVLRDLTGTVHVFPNGTINTLSNMTKDWSAMVFDIGVAYGEDTDRVSETMVEVAEGLRTDENFKDRILEPMELLGVDGSCCS